MKNKAKVLIFTFLMIISLTACDDTSKNLQAVDVPNEEESNDKKNEQNDDMGIEDDEKADIDEKEETESIEPDVSDPEGEETQTETMDITVYQGNDDATAFETEKVQISSLTPETVLEVLLDRGIVTTDIDILSLETVTVEGKDSIEIDFNSAFVSYISNMGSTGEYYVMGSICNTFLDAYDCEQIKITVEGNTLETGHAEYPGYMTKFS